MRSISQLKRLLIEQRECGNLHKESMLCYEIGKKYEEQDKLHLALKYYTSDLEICQSIPDVEGICIALGNISNALTLLKMFSSSFEKQTHRIELAKSAQLVGQLFRGYLGMGWLFHRWSLSLEHLYVDFTYLQESKKYFQMAIELATNSLGLSDTLEAKKRLALVEGEFGNYSEALTLFLQIEQSIGELDVQFVFEFYSSLIDFYLTNNEFELATTAQYKYLKLAQKESNISNELDAIGLLGRIFYQQSMFEEAIECFVQYKSLCAINQQPLSVVVQYDEELERCMKGREKCKELKKRKNSLNLYSGIDLFYQLNEIANEYYEIDMKKESLLIRQEQFKLVQQDFLSTSQLQEFFFDFGLVMEELKMYHEALNAYKSSLQIVETGSNKNHLIKASLLCGIGNVMNELKSSPQTVISIYKEAIGECKLEEDEMYFKINRNLYELYYENEMFEEADDLLQMFRQHFLIEEIVVSDGEREEIESFSYFSNRKPSKKMKSLIGNFVMKSKKLSSSGLNLRAKKMKEKKIDEDFRFTCRTSRPVVHKKTQDSCDSDDHLSQFVIKDTNESCSKNINEINKELEYEVDSQVFVEPEKKRFNSYEQNCIIRDKSKEIDLEDEIDLAEESVLPVDCRLGQNSKIKPLQDNPIYNKNNYTPRLVFLDDSDFPQESFDVQQTNSADFFSDSTDCTAHSSTEPQFPTPIELQIQNTTKRTHPTNSSESSLEGLYSSKIKFYNSYPNPKIITRLSIGNFIDLSNLLLPLDELNSFFKFLAKEYKGTVEEVNLSGNVLTDEELSELLKGRKIISAHSVNLSKNLFTFKIFNQLKRSIDFSNLQRLDLSFLCCCQDKINDFVDFLRETNLKELILQSWNFSLFTEFNLDQFVGVIGKFDRLSLDLSYSLFSETSLKTFLRKLSLSMEFLSSLNLSGIDLKRPDITSLLGELYLCPHLTGLFLNDCNLTLLDFVFGLIEKNISFCNLEIGFNPEISCHQFAELFSFLSKCPKKINRLGIDGIENADFVLNLLHEGLNSIGIKELSLLHLPQPIVELFLCRLKNVNIRIYSSFKPTFALPIGVDVVAIL